MAAAAPTGDALTAVNNPPIFPLPQSFASVVKNSFTQPLSPRTEKKSFADVLVGKVQFPVKEVRMFKGEPAVFFSKEDIEQLASPFKFSLVGKFSYNSRPPMFKIRKFLTSLGLKSLLSVGLLHDSCVLIKLGTEEDYARLLLRAVWYFDGATMKLFKWTPSFNPKEDSAVVAVWVGFPGLPIHFFNKAALFSIAKAVGNPLKTDEPTALLSRPSVARVCVEVDISKDWPKRIWIGEEKQGFWQDVCVENPPLFCGHCKTLGHEEKGCFKLNPSLVSDLKKKKEEEKKAEQAGDSKQNAKSKISQPVKVFRPVVKPAMVSAPSRASDIPPVLGIALTPLPDLEKIKKVQERKNTDKNRGKAKMVSHPSVSGNQKKLLLFPSPPADVGTSKPKDNSGDIFPTEKLVEHPTDQSKSRTQSSASPRSFPVHPLDQISFKIQPLIPAKVILEKPVVLQPSLTVVSVSKSGESFGGIQKELGGKQSAPSVQNPIKIQTLDRYASIKKKICSYRDLILKGQKIQPWVLFNDQSQPSISSEQQEKEIGTGKCQEEKIRSLDMCQSKIKPLDGYQYKDNFLLLISNEQDSGTRGIYLVDKKVAMEKEKVNNCGHVEEIVQNNFLMEEIVQNKIQPLDSPIEFQPSDYQAISKERIHSSIVLGPTEVNNCGYDLEENVISSQPLVKSGWANGPAAAKNWHGPGNLGFEFFGGPNPSGLNPKASAYQPIGLQSSGPLDREGNAFGLQDELHTGQTEKAGPSGLTVWMKAGVGLEGFNSSTAIQGLGSNGLSSDGVSTGPFLLEEIAGPDAIIPINVKGELMMIQPKNNYLHLLDSLLQFIHGRGISISSSLKSAIYNFLLQSGPPIPALSKDNFNWDALRTYFFRHMKNSKIKMTWNLRCTLEQFFQCLETILLEKNVKVAIGLSCNPSLNSFSTSHQPHNLEFIKSYPLPQFQESSPINSLPDKELTPTKSVSSVAFEKRVSFRDALQFRLQKEKERVSSHPRPSILENEELGPCTLNQTGNLPSSQSQFESQKPKFHKFMESGDLRESEVGDNFDFDDFDDYGGYDGGAVNLVPGNESDESWDSEESGTKQFLKGKWRQDYTMRASSSRRSL